MTASPRRRSLFGDVVIIAFLTCQALDGVLTYLGLHEFGHGIEANPLIRGVMPVLGAGLALASAKLFAAMLGILLHLRGVHRAVAMLTALYVGGAVVPWARLLLMR